MKRVIFLLLVSSFFSTFAEDGKLDVSGISEDCKYKEEVTNCINANTGGTERTIEEYVCPTSASNEEIIYQVVLDKEFKEIDEEMDAYIDYLDENKDLYFGPSAQKNVLDGINEIEKIFGEYGDFWDRYLKICNGGEDDSIVAIAMTCAGGKTSIDLSKDYFSESLCQKLFSGKLQIYKDTSYKILQLNKAAVRKDNKKQFFQERRLKYDSIFDAMMINLGYMERIWKKWKSKIKYGHNG